MSCFTFTAPLITPEEERLEKAALTDAERQQLHNEVFGGEQIVHETDKTLRNGTAILNQAISELPTAVKATYLEALERAPELVEKESNPHSFLRCENHDARAAANRLVNYWDVRKKTFGPDKAFLPMTQAGALADEMDYVRKALAVNLPNDEHGRAVILFDRIRSIAKNAPRDSIVRCFFYVVQAMSDNEEVQRRGFVLIINLRGMDLYQHFDRTLTKKLISIIKVAPAKGKAVHGRTGSGKSVVDMVFPVMKILAGRDLRLRMQIHAGSDREILERWEDFGLGKAQMQCFNLDQTMELHHAWLENRRVLEEWGTPGEAQQKRSQAACKGGDGM